VKNANILFFADRLPPLIGGMEMHADYFIKYFTNSQKFPISGIITKDKDGTDCIIIESRLIPIQIDTLRDRFNPSIIFFNSGRWIEIISYIRKIFPNTIFIYRTGGNEILKASLSEERQILHHSRQAFWAQTLNNNIDILITNSKYTEQRLRKIGIKCKFERFVGGVNSSAILSFLKSNIPDKSSELRIFCAARFVPYKNHTLLISIIQRLYLREHKIKLRLAGEGPLLDSIKEQVSHAGLNEVVMFLGSLSNIDVCKEIAQADIYMQLSKDFLTEVPGGSYIHSEGMGRSILEALSAGTYVVAGYSGALNEIINSRKGVLIDLKKPTEELADEVEKVIKRPIKKSNFTDKFCWTKLFQRYEKVFEEMHENIISNRKM
jgi:glycosyltransferase involved in cell wall biosynthesis